MTARKLEESIEAVIMALDRRNWNATRAAFYFFAEAVAADAVVREPQESTIDPGFNQKPPKPEQKECRHCGATLVGESIKTEEECALKKPPEPPCDYDHKHEHCEEHNQCLFTCSREQRNHQGPEPKECSACGCREVSHPNYKCKEFKSPTDLPAEVKEKILALCGQFHSPTCADPQYSHCDYYEPLASLARLCLSVAGRGRG